MVDGKIHTFYSFEQVKNVTFNWAYPTSLNMRLDLVFIETK